MSDLQADADVELLSCGSCQAPVIRGFGNCHSCGSPQSGKEFPYVSHTGATTELAPLFKWWAAWSGLIWVFSGFSLGTTSSLLITGLAVIYLVRILRAYFSN
ncbi:MAG: hypothetical protein O7F73_11870 [Gammaproteobacteria bacterium]|nr:hypothetical protein [Gammaproteobacteria bacterium]